MTTTMMNNKKANVKSHIFWERSFRKIDGTASVDFEVYKDGSGVVYYNDHESVFPRWQEAHYDEPDFSIYYEMEHYFEDPEWIEE